MKKNSYVIIDTNVILNCPLVLEQTVKLCGEVFVPMTVINELNYQKDHGSDSLRKQASLCLSKLIENDAIIKNKHYSEVGRTNDDKIINLAETIAKENAKKLVYLLTNDKDFKLLVDAQIQNLKVVNTREFFSEFSQQKIYNIHKTQEFYNSVMNGELLNAKLVLNHNIDVNFVDAYTGYTPLIQAVRNKDIEMVKFLINIPSIDLNAVDLNKYSLPAISHAVQMHNISIVKLLIEAGANVNEPSKNSCNYYNTPLMIASWAGNQGLVKLLIEAGACINQQDKKNGYTALIKASYNNHNEVVQFLINCGADRTICSFEGKQAIDYACEKNINGSYIDTINSLKSERSYI